MADEYTTGGLDFTVPAGTEVIDGPNAFKAFADDVAAAVNAAIAAIPEVSFDVGIVNKTATYQPVVADANKMIVMNAAGATQITLPSDAAAAFNIGATIGGIRLGAGALSFAAGAGATVYATPGLTFRAQYSMASAVKVASNTWVVSGDVTA